MTRLPNDLIIEKLRKTLLIGEKRLEPFEPVQFLQWFTNHIVHGWTNIKIPLEPTKAQLGAHGLQLVCTEEVLAGITKDGPTFGGWVGFCETRK